MFDAFDCRETLQKQKQQNITTTLKKKELDFFLDGELSLILLVDEIQFFNQIYQFLRTLSAHLHASIRVSQNAYGQPKIYKWQDDRDDYFEEAIIIPKNFSINNLNVAFNEIIQRKKKRNVNDLNNLRIYDVMYSSKKLTGIKVYLQIDVQICQEMQLTLNRELSCFSNMDSVVAYLGAASAKNAINDVNFKIHTAEAIKYVPPSSSTNSSNYFPTILASAFIFLVCMTIIVQNRKRKLISAPVFRPTRFFQGNFIFIFLF